MNSAEGCFNQYILMRIKPRLRSLGVASHEWLVTSKFIKPWSQMAGLVSQKRGVVPLKSRFWTGPGQHYAWPTATFQHQFLYVPCVTTWYALTITPGPLQRTNEGFKTMAISQVTLTCWICTWSMQTLCTWRLGTFLCKLPPAWDKCVSGRSWEFSNTVSHLQISAG